MLIPRGGAQVGPEIGDTLGMKGSPYLYAVSLPERTLRSVSAVSGGLLRELSEVVLPAKIRQAALYRATAGITLRWLIQEVGQVRDIYPEGDPAPRKFTYRYVTGTSIEWASIFTFYLSPVWVLAALGDVTGAGKTLFVEIGETLKEEGLLAADARSETMLQLLDGVERTSKHLALTVNMPPLDAAGLRQEWMQFRKNLASLPAAQLPTACSVGEAWVRLRDASRRANRPVFLVSAALGLSALASVPAGLRWLSQSVGAAVRTTGTVVGQAFLEHYEAAGKEIGAVGFGPYWAGHSRPYLVAAIRNYRPNRRSWTERVLGRTA